MDIVVTQNSCLKYPLSELEIFLHVVEFWLRAVIICGFGFVVEGAEFSEVYEKV